MIWITGLPLPPSANGMYETNVHKVWKTGKGGKRYKGIKTSKRRSDELKTFQDRCLLLKRQYPEQLKQFKKQCEEWIDSGQMLAMDSYCVFHHDRIWTKDGRPQVLDADNYRKALQDAVFRLLDIDDRYVFSGNIEKATCIKKELECSIVRIRPIKAIDIAQIRAKMGFTQPI